MSSDSNRLNIEVRVPLWAILYAIRYGMGRFSHASEDSVELAESFWDNFPRFIQEQIIRDWRRTQRQRFTGLDDPQLAERWDRLAARLQEGKP